MTNNTRLRWCPLWCPLWLCLLMLASLTTQAAYAANTLTLAEASRLALEHNPRLAGWQWQLKRLQSRRDGVSLGPALKLGLDAENLLGNGPASGLDAAEYTLALSSVLRLGDQQQARVGVADARLDLAGSRKRLELLELLGQVTRRHVTLLALQQRLALAENATTLAAKAADRLAKAARRGAASAADKLQAQAALAQARLQQDRLAARLKTARLALASLWGDTRPDFSRVSGDLFRLTPSPDFERLYRRVLQGPLNRQLIQQERLQKAQLALAESALSLDIDWRLGIRQLAASDSQALVFGLSLPLFSKSRNQSEIKAAHFGQLRQQQLSDARRRQLRVTLYRAWQQHRSHRQAVSRLQAAIIPRLEKAAQLAQRAYQRGSYRYSDWARARQKLLAARVALIDNAKQALFNQALIEELTATPLSQDRHQNQSQATNQKGDSHE